MYQGILLVIDNLEQNQAIKMSPEWAKIVTMLTLGLGSMIIGLVPAAFTNYNLRRNPLLLTFLLCFGAGILMATSLVHMLPEVSIYALFCIQIYFNINYLAQ